MENKFIILIVDDNPHNLQVLAGIVEESGYESVLAMNGKQALDFMLIEKPDLILLDIMMPEMDGYDVCGILKQNVQLKDIPVVFLTAKSETEDIVKGFEVGGVDYITKPFNAVELKIRIKTHLELKKSRDEIMQFNEQLKKANKELQDANDIIKVKNLQLKEIMEQLEHTSKTDHLTGLCNRRYIMERIQEEVERFGRNQNGFSIMIADVDFFKKVNDTYGHDCGDYVLKLVSEIFREAVREVDSVSRWGGEEFLFLLPETDLEEARRLAERIRKDIEDRVFVYNKSNLFITMTIGLSVFKIEDSIDDVIKRADNALYDGKNKGRNCVVIE